MDLKRRYRNIRNELISGMNEYQFSIVCGRLDNGGALVLCRNSCMYARMDVGGSRGEMDPFDLTPL